MKKTILAMILCLCAALPLASCNNTYETAPSAPPSGSAAPSQDASPADPSQSGHTESKEGEDDTENICKATNDFIGSFKTEIVQITDLGAGEGEKDFIYWMIDNPIDEWVSGHWALTVTGAEMRDVAAVYLSNWKREALETLDELSELLPEDLYQQLEKLTEQRVGAIEGAAEFSSQFMAWEFPTVGTMWSVMMSEQKGGRLRSLCAELKVYELWAYYYAGDKFGHDVPDDITEFKEKYPVTFENTSEWFKD